MKLLNHPSSFKPEKIMDLFRRLDAMYALYDCHVSVTFLVAVLRPIYRAILPR